MTLLYLPCRKGGWKQEESKLDLLALVRLSLSLSLSPSLSLSLSPSLSLPLSLPLPLPLSLTMDRQVLGPIESRATLPGESGERSPVSDRLRRSRAGPPGPPDRRMGYRWQESSHAVTQCDKIRTCGRCPVGAAR